MGIKDKDQAGTGTRLLTVDSTGLHASMSTPIFANTGVLNTIVAALGVVNVYHLIVGGSVSQNANLAVPANIHVEVLAGGLISHSTYTLSFAGGFSAPLQTVFSGTGAVTFSRISEVYPQWWGGIPSTINPAPVDSGLAIQNAMSSGGKVILTKGNWSSSIGLVTNQTDFSMDGSGWDDTRIRYTGTGFVPVISVGDGINSCTGIQLTNFAIQGGTFMAGKAKWGIYAPFFNSGCMLKNIQIRDCVGMIYMQEAYLCAIESVYCTTTPPNRTAAGITQAEWLEVYGPGCAPIFIARANNSEINGLHGYRIGSEVSGGVTPFATMILSGGGTSFNNLSLESCGTYTQSAVTYNLRSKNLWALGVVSGVLEDEAMPGCTFNGMYNENCWATEAFAKTFSNTKVSIENAILYNIWSDTYMFDNQGSSDLVIRNLDAYRARCPELFHVLSTPGSISQGAQVIFENSRFSAGERVTEGSISGGLANLFDSQNSLYPLGCAETPPAYPRARRTPLVISGYAVTSGTSGLGDYIQVGGGYFLNSYNKLVSCMRASEDNAPVWYWLAPTEASKYYRVFVGSVGQPYLVKYNAAQTDPKGDWIAEFATNGANAITGLVSNPRVTTYEGEYTPGPSGRTLTFGAAAPVSGYWEVGDRCFNTVPTPEGVAFWECTTAGTPGTWSPHSLDGAFPILLGRSGGQTLIGGIASADRLNLSSTSHATKGQIRLGGGTTDFIYDEVNKRLGIGKVPTSKIDITESLDGGDINVDVANAFTSAGSIDEAVAYRALFGTSLAGHLRFKKEEDFTGGTERTASATLMVRKDGTDTDMIVASGANNTVSIPNAELIIRTKTPASAAATGTAGMIAWDASYIYICTAANTWKRVAIATW